MKDGGVIGLPAHWSEIPSPGTFPTSWSVGQYISSMSVPIEWVSLTEMFIPQGCKDIDVRVVFRVLAEGKDGLGEGSRRNGRAGM